MSVGIGNNKTAEIVAKNQLHEGDTGSPEVQVAIFTERINHLTEQERFSHATRSVEAGG